MKFRQWPKRDPNKNYFLVTNEVFTSYQSPGNINLLLSAEHRGQRNLSVLPQLQDHRQGAEDVRNTVSKYVRSLEEKGLIPHRADHDTEQGRQTAQRKPALHHLPYPGGGGIVL